MTRARARVLDQIVDLLCPTLVGEACWGIVNKAFLSAFHYHRWHSPIDGTIVKAYVERGVYYREHHSGKLTGTGSDSVILLHGCGLDHNSLCLQAEHLSRSHRVLSPDIRGHGGSCPSQQPYDMQTFASDVALLCRRLNLQQSLIFGHSMGGNVALTLRKLHPERVSAIVLIDSAVFIQKAKRKSIRSELLVVLSDDGFLQYFKQALRSISLKSEAQSLEIINSIAVELRSFARRSGPTPSTSALLQCCWVVPFR